MAVCVDWFDRVGSAQDRKKMTAADVCVVGPGCVRLGVGPDRFRFGSEP